VPDASHQFPAEPETLTAALSAYLGAAVEQLRVLASGWETTLYEFELRTPSGLLPGVEAGIPLVLRFYPSLEAADKGALEYLGELYVETGQIEKAKENVVRLQQLCPSGCEELADLEKAVSSTGPKVN